MIRLLLRNLNKPRHCIACDTVTWFQAYNFKPKYHRYLYSYNGRVFDVRLKQKAEPSAKVRRLEMEKLISDIKNNLENQNISQALVNLLELGLEINEDHPGIKIDDLRKIFSHEIISGKFCKILGSILEGIQIQYRDAVDNENQHAISNYFAPIKIALAIFSPSQEEDSKFDFDDKYDELVQMTKDETNNLRLRSERLGGANIQFLSLNEHKKTIPTTQDGDRKVDAIDHFSRNFREKRKSYFEGDDNAFQNFRNECKSQLQDISKHRSKTKEIIGSIFAALTIAGLAVGAGQLIKSLIEKKPPEFLFWKQAASSKIAEKICSSTSEL